jgi:hypothetical protein
VGHSHRTGLAGHPYGLPWMEQNEKNELLKNKKL